MSRAISALTTQAELQDLRERSYGIQVSFCTDHKVPENAHPESIAAYRGPARLAIYEAAQELTRTLDAALDAQAQIASLLREYEANT